MGHGFRSDERAFDHLAELVPQLRVLGRLETADDRYFHRASALSFIDAQTVVYYEPALTPESVRCIQSAVPRVINVGDVDANEHFACNNLVVGSSVLLDGCTPTLRANLAKAGYDVVTCDMSEFKKSGGSLCCLVLNCM